MVEEPCEPVVEDSEGEGKVGKAGKGEISRQQVVELMKAWRDSMELV